jgi:hypothetical protein
MNTASFWILRQTTPKFFLCMAHKQMESLACTTDASLRLGVGYTVFQATLMEDMLLQSTNFVR